MCYVNALFVMQNIQKVKHIYFSFVKMHDIYMCGSCLDGMHCTSYRYVNFKLLSMKYVFSFIYIYENLFVYNFAVANKKTFY